MKKLFLVAALVSIGACGDSDDGDSDAGPEGGVPTGLLDSGMTPVTPLTDASSTSTGAVTIMCGTNTCTQPGADFIPVLEPLLAGFLPGVMLSSLLPQPCCAEGDACGSITPTDGGSECLPPPPSDPRCPDTNLLVFTFVGCCDEAMGLCGINFGGTCSAMAGGQSCGADGGESDGGSDDAG